VRNPYSKVSQLSRRSFLVLAPLSVVTLTACSSQSASGDGALVAWPARNLWPAEFQQAAPEVQEAYRFAVANPMVLQYIPCFCGCVNQGHTSNKDCYVREFRPDGSVLLEPMSFG
jgi:hypothetical protein